MESATSAYVRFVFPSKVERFFEALKAGKLISTRCVKCKTLRCPPSIDCPKCLTSDAEWIELSGRGIVISHTVVHVAPPSFAKQSPYIVGIIRLDEGPQMMAQLTAVPEAIGIGTRVRVVFGEGVGGQPTYRFELDPN